MTTTDWIIDITLIFIVLRQVRETAIDRQFVLIPAAIVLFTANKYLHDITLGGNDRWLIGLALGLGSALGLAGGLLTRVRVVDGQARARAGLAAAALWVASMGARLGFIIWITHSAGAAALGRFSMEHHITGGDAWQTALVLLALSEVIVRLVLIVGRGRRLTAAAAPAPAPAKVLTNS